MDSTSHAIVSVMAWIIVVMVVIISYQKLKIKLLQLKIKGMHEYIDNLTPPEDLHRPKKMNILKTELPPVSSNGEADLPPVTRPEKMSVMIQSLEQRLKL